MRKNYILILLSIITVLSVNAQDYSTLHMVRDTPQANILNPGYLPQSSFLTIPVLGDAGFRVMNSFSIYDIVDNRTLDLSEIPDASELNIDFNLNLINFGIYLNDKSMLTFSTSLKTNIDFMYPTGAFDLIVDNPIGRIDSFDVDFKTATTIWGEVAVGYTRAIDNNWSVGVKLKYLVGMFGGTTNNTKFKIDKTATSYSISGDVDIQIGGYDTEKKEILPEDLLNNRGWAVDFGAYYKADDNRYSIGLSVLDLGYINWTEGSHILSKDPSLSYNFNGFGDIEEVLNGGDLTIFSDQIYSDMMEALEIDTVKMSFVRALPTTIHLSGNYSLDPSGQHTLSGSFLNRIYGSSAYDYSLTAGYSYSSKSKRFRLMSSLTNRKHDPLSLGLGMMCSSSGFQFYLMGDMSIARLVNIGKQRSIGLNIGMNILLGRRRHYK